MLRLGFFGEKLPNFIFLMLILWSVGNRRVHGGFENIFTFETYLGSHASNQNEKPRSEGSRPKVRRTLDMQHTTKTN